MIARPPKGGHFYVRSRQILTAGLRPATAGERAHGQRLARLSGLDWACTAQPRSSRSALLFSVALVEIIVGAIAGSVIGLEITRWVNFLADPGDHAHVFASTKSIAISSAGLRGPASASAWRASQRLLAFLLWAHYVVGSALAAGADRRHLPLDRVGFVVYAVIVESGSSRSRARQDHPRRLLHHRPRYGVRPRHRLCPLRCIEGAARSSNLTQLYPLRSHTGVALAEMITKFFGILPLTRLYEFGGREEVCTTLLMSTGLTSARSRRCSGSPTRSSIRSNIRSSSRP